MAGVKTLINTTTATLQITLYARAGSNPVNQGPALNVTLLPNQTLTVQYGSDANPFLNGIAVFTIANNDLYSKVQFVLARGSELDNVLNNNNVLVISKVLTDYLITGVVSPFFPS
ncbi:MULTISPECIES: hypothetical protein [Bacillaceae]|uniref:DUF4183 domain-containing protein n=1 Tax=Metabacillus sediminis TaxID=3117746 RepID=A0ABZ2NIB4_9BACI|nr:hypothetical protein [Bacillus sp. SJS]KZZ84002.1 hypothetical protein AS29_012450 [Bacillus sp. SJS]